MNINLDHFLNRKESNNVDNGSGNDEAIVDLIKFNDYIQYFADSEKVDDQGESYSRDINHKFKTEAYYCTGPKFGKLHGSLIISSNLIYFEPHKVGQARTSRPSITSSV